MIKFSVKLIFLVFAIISSFMIYQREQLEFLALSRIDPLPEVYTMVNEERYAEAADHLDFFMEYEYVNQNPEAQKIHNSILKKRSSWKYQLGKLSEGLFSGTSDETIGQVAGVATDFFVIGDIRDLAKQGVNLASGEEVDKVLVALASIGVVASCAQILSATATVSTSGAAAPAVAGTTVVKSGLVTLKIARKIGKLPPWLCKVIIKTAKTIKKSKSLRGFVDTLSNVNTLGKTRGGFKLLSHTRDAASLKRMANFAKTFGNKSATIYRVGGKLAVKSALQVKEFGKNTIMLATTYGKKGIYLLNKYGHLKFIKNVTRISKMGYKGDILELMAKLLSLLPFWVLYIIVLISIIIFIPWNFIKKVYTWISTKFIGNAVKTV